MAGLDVSFEAVAKRYRGPAGAVVALRKLSFTLTAGQGLLLAGPPGSGKSTLLALAGALMRPTTGEVRVGEQVLSRLPEHALARFRLEQVGFLFQGFRLLRGFSAVENVELALLPHGLGTKTRRSRALAALVALGLEERTGFRVNDLSGGEQQRVALARALVGEPGLLIVDEPTSNVDRATAELVLGELLAHKRRGATLLIASHDPELIQASGLSDRLARFESIGRVHVE